MIRTKTYIFSLLVAGIAVILGISRLCPTEEHVPPGLEEQFLSENQLQDITKHVSSASLLNQTSEYDFSFTKTCN